MMKRKLKRLLSLLLTFTMVLTTCVFAGMPLLTVRSKAAAPTGALRAHEDGSFTVLQVADVQSTYPVPDQWLNALRLSIATAQPDLIVLSGDNVSSGMDFNSFKNAVDQITAEFYTLVTTKTGDGSDATYSTEEIPIPFAVTFGNHDYSDNNDYSYPKNENENTLEKQLAYFSTKPGFVNLSLGSYSVNDFSQTVTVTYKENGETKTKNETITDVACGTGYIDVWDAAGSQIVQRVILLNSGSEKKGSGYARPGNSQRSYALSLLPEKNSNVISVSAEVDKYSKVVEAVNAWTSDPSIKCIGFQHIPLHEFTSGDSNETKILLNNAVNTSNPTVSGVYGEACCASAQSTSELYNAYAKDNVYGVFFGHDHSNTVTGVATVGGKKLRMGYGGGLNTQYNYSDNKTSLFSHYNLNSAYTGPDDTVNFKKESFAYADYLEELEGVYGPKTYTPAGVSYITELFAEIAPLGWWQVDTFQRAYDNVREKADYCLSKMANDSGADADMNKGCGSDSDYVALGFSRTTDRTKAVTGIIGLHCTSSSHPQELTVYLQDNTPITYHQEDNNCNCTSGTGQYNYIYFTTDPKAGPPITDIYMTYENGANLYGRYGRSTSEYTSHGTECSNILKPYKMSFAVAEAGAANTYTMQDWDAFDYNRGCGSSTPYIYVAYASNGTVDVTRAYYDLLVAYYKYGHVQDSSHQVYDSLTYDPYDSYRNAVDDFLNNPTTGVSKTPYSEQPYEQINKMTKVLVDAYNALKFKNTNNGRQVKSEEPQYTDFYVAVPDTIYLNPAGNGSAQYYLNNKIDTNGEIVPDGTASTTGTFEIVCKDAYDVQIAIRRMKPMTSGQRFQFSETKAAPNYYAFDTTSGHPNSLYVTAQSTATDHGAFISGPYDSNAHSYSISGGDGGPGHENFPKMEPAVKSDGTEYIKGNITTFAMETNLLAAGDRQMIEWQFTITRGNGTTAQVYAYSTMYAPYTSPVGAGAGVKASSGWLQTKFYGYMENIAWWSGVQGYDPTWAPDNKWSEGDLDDNYQARAKTVADNQTQYLEPLTNGVWNPSGNLGAEKWMVKTTSAGNGMDPSFRYAYNDEGTTAQNWTFTMCTGYKALLAVDSSRFDNLNEIPNLTVSAMITHMQNSNSGIREYRYSMQNTGPTYHGFKQNDSDWNNNIKLGTTSGNFSSVGKIVDNAKQNYSIEKKTYDISFNFKFTSNTKTGSAYGTYIGAAVFCPISISCTDKSPIRKTVGKYESLSPQKEWLLDDKVSLYTTYMNALINASYALGDPTYHDVDLNVSTNYTTPLSAAFSAMGGENQKRSCVIDGVTVPFFTTEINYGLTGNLDGFGHRSDYTVAPVIYDLYKYQGPAGDNPEGDGIYALNTVTVQPYDLCADYGFNYMGWMDGEGFLQEYAVDPTKWSGITEGFLPQENDTVTDNMIANFYTDFDGVTDTAGKHPTADPVNYGHITAETIINKLNLFHFYYKKTDHTLTFDVGGGKFTYSDGTEKTGKQYSTVAAEDDSFVIGFTPTRSGYFFDGWEVTQGDGDYDRSTNTYTFGTSDATLTAIWVKQSWLYINSDGGYSNNNLIYFYDALDTMEFTNPKLTANGSYEDDSDITLTGQLTESTGEITPQLDNKMVVYLQKGHTYQLSYDCTNHDMDFYAYKKGTGMGTRSGRMKNYLLDSRGNYIQNEDGTYTNITTFTVGGTGTDATDRTWNGSGFTGADDLLTGEYNFRISYPKNKPDTDYTITNLRIIEINPGDVEDIDPNQRSVDNRIYQLENRTRMIKNPEDRPDGYIFGGWEVWNVDANGNFTSEIGDTMDTPAIVAPYIYENSQGGFTFIYQNKDIGIKTIWIKPIGVALDNLFNFYEFRYNAVSRVLNGAGKTSGDTVRFDNINQTITVKDDGTPNVTTDSNGNPVDNYDVYTSHSANCYDMPLFVDADGNKVRTYLFTMDVTVTSGKGQYFVFGQQGDTNKTNSSSWILTSEYPTASKHVSTIICAADDTEYLRVRFGFNAKNSDVTYSNIRIVPLNSVNTTDSNDPFYIAKGGQLQYAANAESKAKFYSILDEDTLGYAYDNSEALNEEHRTDPRIINPTTGQATITYNLLEEEYLGGKLYAPERYGYAFLGWKEDNIIIPENQEDFFQRNTEIDGDKTLWSCWSPDEFILKYDENSEDTITSMPVNSNPGATETSATWTLIFDSATKAANDDIISKTVPVDSTDGETLFMGWCTVPTPTDEEPGEMFYPGGDLPRKTVDALYGKKDGDNNVLTLYAQWYSIEDANDDAERNEEGNDLEQLTENIVMGIEVGSDGTKTPIYEMKDTENKAEVTKFDTETHNVYTDAIDGLNDALDVYTYGTDETDPKKTVTAETTAAIKEACNAVIDAAEDLEDTEVLTEIDATYNNNFIIKKDGTEETHSLADMNLNHYATATLTDAKNAKDAGNTAAYSNYTASTAAADLTKRTAFADVSGTAAQTKLNDAVKTMAESFVDKEDIGVDPTFKVYETPTAVEGHYSTLPETIKSKIRANNPDITDIDAVNYVYAGKGYYTYYCYTNKPNPTVVIDIDEISPASSSRVCYPTNYNLVTGDSSTITTGKQIVDNKTYDTYLANGLGTCMTASNANYYKEKQVVALTPSFTGNSGSAEYVFTAYDDSYVADGGQNLATKTALSGGTADEVEGNEKDSSGSYVMFKQNEPSEIKAITGLDSTTEVRIYIDYKPANGFDVTGSQWSNGTNFDQYLKQYHLWRTSGGASNWEIHGKNDSASQIYHVYDEEYEQLNYCSFIYIFDVAGTNNNSACQIKSTNINDVHDFIKANFGSLVDYVPLHGKVTSDTAGLGYWSWSGYDGWAPNFYPKSNSYVYVHCIDRWGNVVDKVFQIELMDPEAITSQSSRGSVVLTESGGSGISTASINADSFEIITDDESELNGNVYNTAGNTVKLRLNTPNKSYTLKISDNAENETTVAVKTDAEGNLVMTFEDTCYTNGVYSFKLNDFEINLYSGPDTVKGKVVDVQYEPAVGSTNTYNVKVEDRANMLQFMELDHGNGTGTRSYDRYDENVTIISYDKDGNRVSSTSKDLAYEIWTVETPLADGKIGVRVKEGGSSVWEDTSIAYNFKNIYAEAESGLISASLAKTSGKKGAVGFTVVAGADVKDVQFKNEEGETTTISASKATVNDDGTLTFTGKVWFHGTGVRIATIRIRDTYGWHDAGRLTYEINK